MLGVYTDNLRRWREEAEIDYFAYFIKAYIPFNAWFRHSYPLIKHEFEILSNLKSDGNIVRSRIVALLEGENDDAKRFKAHIGLLNERLESQRLTDKRGVLSFTSCHVADNAQTTVSGTHNNFNYSAERVGKNQFTCKLTKGTALTPVFSCPNHNGHNLESLRTSAGFSGLSDQQRSKLEWYYNQLNPQIVVNLLDVSLNVSRPVAGLAPSRGGVSAPRTIVMGTTSFCDHPEYISAALIEVIYRLRCLLFHGEIVPTSEHNEVYEPAYFILRRFLKCII